MTTNIDLSSVGGSLLDASSSTYTSNINDSPLSMNVCLEAAFNSVSDLSDFTTNVHFHLILNPTVWKEWKQSPEELRKMHIDMVKCDIRCLKLLKDRVGELVKLQMEILDSWDPAGARVRGEWENDTNTNMIPGGN